jgi:hypothetical protein
MQTPFAPLGRRLRAGRSSYSARIVGLAAGPLVLTLAACPGPQSGGGGGDGGTGGPSCSFGCDNCDEPHMWTCECFAQNGWNTYPCPNCSESTPESWCRTTICEIGQPNSIFTDWRLLPVPICVIVPPGDGDGGIDETGSGLLAGCGNWDPSAAIAIVNRVYYVDEAFVDATVADPSPIAVCDDAWLDESSSPPGFEVRDAVPGDLLYELGLRNGDVPLTINSLPLETYADAIAAFGSLYMDHGETSYSLRVKRGSLTLTFNYEVQ